MVVFAGKQGHIPGSGFLLPVQEPVEEQCAEAALFKLGCHADAGKIAPAGLFRINGAGETGTDIALQCHQQIHAGFAGCGDLSGPHGIAQGFHHFFQTCVDIGVVAGHGMALCGHFFGLLMDPGRGLIVSQIQIHGPFPAAFPVAAAEHPVVEGDVDGNARGIVVLMVFGARDHPGQADGVEAGHRCVDPPGGTEGVLQGVHHGGGIFVAIGFLRQQNAADIAPFLAPGDMLAGAAVAEAQDFALLFQHEGEFRGEVRVPQQNLVKIRPVQGCEAGPDTGCIPDMKQGGIVARPVISNHRYFLA